MLLVEPAWSARGFLRSPCQGLESRPGSGPEIQVEVLVRKFRGQQRVKLPTEAR